MIYPPDDMISYSPSMRELVLGGEGTTDQPAGISGQPGHQIYHDGQRFSTLPRDLGHSTHSRGSDVTMSASLPRNIPVRYTYVQQQQRAGVGKSQNIAVVKPSGNPSMGYKREQSRTQQTPWQPQEIRSHVAGRLPAAQVRSTPTEDEIFLWQREQLVVARQESPQSQLARQQEVSQQPITDEDEVGFMALQDHHDWIRQQNELLRQREEQEHQTLRQKQSLNNYLYEPERLGIYGNTQNNRTETSFTGSASGRQGGPSNQAALPRKSNVKSYGVQVLPELALGNSSSRNLNHVNHESSTDDVTGASRNNSGGGNQGNSGLPSYAHHERFRSISPIVEYLNESGEGETLETETSRNHHHGNNPQRSSNVPITLIL